MPIPYYRLWNSLWLIFLLVCWPLPVQAQKFIDMLLGPANKKTAIQLKTPKDRILSLYRTRLALLSKQIRWTDKKQKDSVEQLKRELQTYQQLVLHFRKELSSNRLRSSKEERQILLRLIAQFGQNSEEVHRLRSAMASKKQNLLSLQEILKNYLMTQKTLPQRLKEDYPSSQQRDFLKKDLEKVRRRLLQTYQEATSSKKQFQELDTAQEENQRLLDQVRRFLVKRKPHLKLSPQNPPTTRPQRTYRTGILRREQAHPKRAYLIRLFQEQRFHFYRHHATWISIRKSDELLEQEVLAARANLYRLLIAEIKTRLKDLLAHSQEGIWFHRQLRLNTALLQEIVSNTSQLFEQAPERLRDMVKNAPNKIEKVFGMHFWAFGALWFCLLFLLYFFTRILRRHTHRLIEMFVRRAEANTATRDFWRVLRVVTQCLHDVSYWFVTCILIWLTSRLANEPDQGVSWIAYTSVMILLLRAAFVLSEQLFSQTDQVRFFPNLDDLGAKQLRSILKLGSLFAFLCLPILKGLRLLGDSHVLIQFLETVFYAVLLCFLIVMLLRRDALSSLVSPDTFVGRLLILTIYNYYPALLLAAFGVFGIYVYGYINFAGYLVWGGAMTSIIISVAFGLHHFLWGAVLWIFGFSKESDGWLNVEKKWARNFVRTFRWFTGIILFVFSVLFILGVWGVTDGTRTILHLLTYPFVQVKDTQVSILSLVKLGLALGISFWLSKRLRKSSRKYIYPLFGLSQANQYAANAVLGYTVVIIGGLFGLQWMGVGIGVLAVFAGVIGIGIGFGIQNIASNFISGLIITFGQPIKVGDVIEVGGLLGEVKEVSARSTTIETVDYRTILVPNAEVLTTKVINWTMGPPYILAGLKVGVAYGSDVVLVMNTLRTIAAEHPKVLQEPPPTLRFNDFGASSLDFCVWCAVSNPMERFAILSELRVQVESRFRELGITIAFPQQDIHFDEDLKQAVLTASQAYTQSFMPVTESRRAPESSEQTTTKKEE